MANEAIVFPDDEQLLADYLNGLLDPPVGTAVPNPRPPTFYRIMRIGGPRATLITDSAQILVESWADRESTAKTMAQLVRAHINALPGQSLDGHVVYKVAELAGPGNLPDLESGQCRYVQSFQIDIRGAAA